MLTEAHEVRSRAKRKPVAVRVIDGGAAFFQTWRMGLSGIFKVHLGANQRRYFFSRDIPPTALFDLPVLILEARAD
jgi:hypothetical protein